MDVYLPPVYGPEAYTNRIRDVLYILETLKAHRRCSHKHTVAIHRSMRVHSCSTHCPLMEVNLHGLWYFGRIELSVVQSREVSAI